jgi:hypothetical protein
VPQLGAGAIRVTTHSLKAKGKKKKETKEIRAFIQLNNNNNNIMMMMMIMIIAIIRPRKCSELAIALMESKIFFHSNEKSTTRFLNCKPRTAPVRPIMIFE